MLGERGTQDAHKPHPDLAGPLPCDPSALSLLQFSKTVVLTLAGKSWMGPKHKASCRMLTLLPHSPLLRLRPPRSPQDPDPTGSLPASKMAQVASRFSPPGKPSTAGVDPGVCLALLARAARAAGGGSTVLGSPLPLQYSCTCLVISRGATRLSRCPDAELRTGLQSFGLGRLRTEL
ncbi:hypothetical protein NDU88_005875 [Pleurodeles waltl]|uniref:Uncharacterized protein n=1 Tax=Pleurodeles waltl TaxID=8319 RepID=A0AAV7NTH8_PLEWA|nr:hypothetical protein NDU88_005875 [Pleurodeles waltl]